MANVSDEVKQCAVCKVKGNSENGNLSLNHHEFSRNPDTGKGVKVPRYICDACKAAIDKRIKDVAHTMPHVATATRLALAGV